MISRFVIISTISDLTVLSAENGKEDPAIKESVILEWKFQMVNYIQICMQNKIMYLE